MKNVTQNSLIILKIPRLVVLTCFAFILLETSCEKWDLEAIDFVEVTTSSSIEMTDNSIEVIVFGEIEGLSPENSVEQHGHVWSSTIEVPTLSDKDRQTTFLKRSNGTFSSTLEGLAPGLAYYYRAYVLHENQPIYGEVKTFTNNSISFEAKVESFANQIQNSSLFQVDAEISISNIEQGITIADYGVVWGIETQPRIEEEPFISKGNTSTNNTPITFTAQLTDLRPGFTYVRPYLIIGGLVFYGNEECYNVGDVWIRKGDFPDNLRVLPAGFSIGGKSYLGTGSEIFDIFKDFWEYDPQTDVWTQKTDFSGIARFQAIGFSINDKGYLGTGITGPGGTILKDFWEYDPQSDTWAQKADVGGPARGRATGFSINGKGYVGLGFTDADNLQDFWEYDPAANTWTEKANFGGGDRLAAVGFSINGKGYIGTGSDNAAGSFDDFWEYDPQTDVWMEKANFGGGDRSSAVGFSINDKGYIGTGGNLDDFWEYDPQTDAWTEKANFGGGGTNDALGVSIDGKGYIMSAVFSKEVWVYVPEVEK